MTPVLVVDDCEVDHYICRDIIESVDESIEILDAYDGSEALDIVTRIQKYPYLILLDINMPGMDGFEFLKEYEQKIHPNSTVAMLSSSSNPDDKNKALAHSFVKAFIVKPLEKNTLSQLLDCVE